MSTFYGPAPSPPVGPMSGNYPPGAEAELNRRAAAEEAWEAYVEEFLDESIDFVVDEICGGPLELPHEKQDQLDRAVRLIVLGWADEDILKLAADDGEIPGFDAWMEHEDDPDRRRDEMEDR